MYGWLVLKAASIWTDRANSRQPYQSYVVSTAVARPAAIRDALAGKHKEW